MVVSGVPVQTDNTDCKQIRADEMTFSNDLQHRFVLGVLVDPRTPSRVMKARRGRKTGQAITSHITPATLPVSVAVEEDGLA